MKHPVLIGLALVIVAGIAVGISVQIFVGALITSLQTSLVDQTIGDTRQRRAAQGENGLLVRRRMGDCTGLGGKNALNMLFKRSENELFAIDCLF